MNFKIENMEGFFEWVKTCPYQYSISSMSGGFVHLKVLIPVDKKVVNKIYVFKEKSDE